MNEPPAQDVERIGANTEPREHTLLIEDIGAAHALTLAKTRIEMIGLLRQIHRDGYLEVGGQVFGAARVVKFVPGRPGRIAAPPPGLNGQGLKVVRP